MKKNRTILTIFLVTLLGLVLVQSVSAVGIFDSFNKILGGDSLGDIYDNHGLWIDLILYLFVFVYAADVAFSKLQGFGKMSKVIGIALAISATVFESTSNFRIGSFGPYVVAVLMFLFAFGVYKLINGLGMGKGYQAGAFAYIAAYGFVSSAAPEIIKLLSESDNEVLGFVLALFQLGLAAAMIIAIIALIGWVGGMRRGGGDGGGLSGPRNDESQEDRDARAAERVQIEEMNALNKIDSLEKRNINDTKNMIKDIDLIINILKSGKVRKESYDKIRDIVHRIQPSWHEIVSVEKGITTLSNELNQLEASEFKLVREAANKAFSVVKTEQKSKYGGSFRGEKALTARQIAFIADAERNLKEKINSTKNDLNQRINEAHALESGVIQPFQQAMDAISRNQPSLAIAQLEIAKRKLVSVGKLLQNLESTDIKRIKADIAREFNDFKNDDKIANTFRGALGKSP